MRGVPWCPDPQVGAEVEVAVAPAPLVREVDLPPDPPPAAAPEPRRVYIRRVELMKHGFTPGCPGCEAVLAGTPPRGHTEPCRMRIETAMRGDKDGGEAPTQHHHWRHRRNHHRRNYHRLLHRPCLERERPVSVRAHRGKEQLLKVVMKL